MLVEHHKGAIVMSDDVLADGRDAEIALVASRTATYSRRAIGQLTTWRRRWAEPFLRELTSPAAQSMPASSWSRTCSAPDRDVHVVVVAQGRVAVARIRRVPIGVQPSSPVQMRPLKITYSTSSAQALSAAQFATRQPNARPWALG